MAHESQTTRHKLLMASLEKASGFPLSGSKSFEVQLGQSTDPVPYLEVVGHGFEDTSGYPTLEFPEQAPVRFDSSPAFRDFNLLAAISTFAAKTDGTPQTLVAVLETLVDIISENKDGLLDSLTKEDYQRLTTTRDKLIEVVSKDENHFLLPLLAFVNNLIKNHDGILNSPIREHYRSTHHPERISHSANRPRVKLTDLLPQESQTIEDIQDVNAAALKPRRSERVGRPADRPRVKLADLLEREAEHIAADERDTETPANSEAW